jgi:hypothetical protein
MEHSESIKEISKALCVFHSEVGKVKKTSTNPFFKSKYADLSSILDVISQPLVNAGLSFVQFPTENHGMTTMLMHESGEWLKGNYNMEPTKKDPQGLGSVITYQRRYALGAVLGLNIDVDDDGNGASEEPTIKDILNDLKKIKTEKDRGAFWTKHKAFQKDQQFIDAIKKKANEIKSNEQATT